VLFNSRLELSRHQKGNPGQQLMFFPSTFFIGWLVGLDPMEACNFEVAQFIDKQITDVSL